MTCAQGPGQALGASWRPGSAPSLGSIGLSLGAGGAYLGQQGPGRGQTGAFRGPGLVRFARVGARDRPSRRDGEQSSILSLGNIVNILSILSILSILNTDQTDQTDCSHGKKSCALVEKVLDLLAQKSIMDVIRAGVYYGIGGEQ